jgi:hypothetical protein
MLLFKSDIPFRQPRLYTSFWNVVFSSFQNTVQWTKSKNPVILSIMHHHQNRLESADIFTILYNVISQMALIFIRVAVTSQANQAATFDDNFFFFPYFH